MDNNTPIHKKPEWEYKLTTCFGSKLDQIKHLDDETKHGWELVGTTQRYQSRGDEFDYVWKRRSIRL